MNTVKSRGVLGALTGTLCICGCAHNYQRWAPNLETVRTATVVAPNDAVVRATAKALPRTAEDLREAGRAYDFYSGIHIRSPLAGASAQDAARVNTFRLETMYGEEYAAIAAAKGGDHQKRIGLALSGGGIRSASFSLGVLQGLYELGVLKDVGYLSTVSGGGYAGGWLMTHSDRPADELLAPASPHQQHLQQHGRYLNQSHYSHGGALTFGRALGWSFVFPINLICNILFDADINTAPPALWYRQGLQSAYLYDQPLVGQKSDEGRATKSISHLKPGKDYPFWIINTHLALRDNESHHKNRSGDLFEITPQRAGGTSVGYVKVPDQLTFETRWMSAAHGVAISGAAIDASSLKMPWYAELATVPLMMDLGYFVNGWNYGWVAGDGWGRNISKNAWFWLSSPVSELWSFAHPDKINYHMRDDHAKRNYLTDGGHFDNLGLYALVRRGCRLIIVSDATQDPLVSSWDRLSTAEKAGCFADLREAEAKIRSDFGCELVFDWSAFHPIKGPEGCLLMGEIKNLPVDIAQGSSDSVTLLIVKAAHDFSQGPRSRATFVDAEKAAHPAFPHDSTVNQFYAERKVLSYQTLGRDVVLDNASCISNHFNSVK